jgi:hypothetical protein
VPSTGRFWPIASELDLAVERSILVRAIALSAPLESRKGRRARGERTFGF